MLSVRRTDDAGRRRKTNSSVLDACGKRNTISPTSLKYTCVRDRRKRQSRIFSANKIASGGIF
jgi:hypothetical protein